MGCVSPRGPQEACYKLGECAWAHSAVYSQFALLPMDTHEDENDVEDYEQICEIRGNAWLIWLGRPRIRLITHWIGTRTSPIADGKFTCTPNCLKSQFLMMISLVPLDLSLSCPEFYHHLKT